MTTHEVENRTADRRERVSIERFDDHEHQERIVEDLSTERRLWSFRITRVIYILFGILEALLGLRFIFKLIGANAANPFAHGIYQFTSLFLSPFSSLLANPALGASILEITTLISMIIYLLGAWLLSQIVWLFFYRLHTYSVTTIDRQGDHIEND
jgi:uncharacterized membrane protein